MNDDATSKTSGPVMLATSKVLDPGPTRIGSLGKNVTLPRTVQLNVLIAGVICAVPGAVVGVILSQIIGGFSMIVLGALAGGFVGYVLVSWSPFQNESLVRFFTVQARTRTDRIETDCEGQGQEGLDRSDDTAICPSCYLEVEIDEYGDCKEHKIQRRFFVGICQLPRLIQGPVQIRGNAVEVDPHPQTQGSG